MTLVKDMELNARTRNALLEKGLLSSDDILHVLPNHYHDYRELKDIHDCKPGDYAAIKGRMSYIDLRSSSGRKYMLIKIDQGLETINVMSYQNTWLYKQYEMLVFAEIVVCGKVQHDPMYGYSIQSPEIIAKAEEFIPRIEKVYPSRKGISDRTLRDLIGRCLPLAEEPLPEPVEKALTGKVPAISYPDALRELHFPTSPTGIRYARERLIINDLLYFSAMLPASEPERRTKFGFIRHSLLDEFISRLPFELTRAQAAAVEMIRERAYNAFAVNCLVQGDVGCGKTIVAACAMVNAAENGYQSVLLAPRTVLAEQHYHELNGYAQMLGLKAVFLHSGMKAAERKKALSEIRSGEASFIIGTHACVGKDVGYKDLGLIIVDEEHLFGVGTKTGIRRKAAEGAHFISMTATPIPRTLADVLYGENCRIINILGRPAGRLDVKTCAQKDRSRVLPFIRREIEAGHQAYVVVPQIDEAEENGVTSLEKAERIYRSYFEPLGINVGVLNGRMKPSEIEETIGKFKGNDCQVLVATSVVEVGVSIGNATVIVIESAERFGLASLHQLRGRVGRSSLQSYCILVTEEPGNERIQVICKEHDGFRISEMDLELRGTGNLIGSEQSGTDRFVDEMLANRELFEKCREVANEFRGTGYLDGLLELYRKENGDGCDE